MSTIRVTLDADWLRSAEETLEIWEQREDVDTDLAIDIADLLGRVVFAARKNG